MNAVNDESEDREQIWKTNRMAHADPPSGFIIYYHRSDYITMKQANTSGLPFQNLRGKDKFYVDKSLLIKDILDQDDCDIYLFTRPRRFGKTTNITMLDAFFNIEYKGNT